MEIKTEYLLPIQLSPKEATKIYLRRLGVMLVIAIVVFSLGYLFMVALAGNHWWLLVIIASPFLWAVVWYIRASRIKKSNLPPTPPDTKWAVPSSKRAFRAALPPERARQLCLSPSTDIAFCIVSDVSQRVESIPYADDADKAKLKQLIERLTEMLRQAPEDRAEDAKDVLIYIRLLIEIANMKKLDDKIVQHVMGGLKKSAENITDVLPAVSLASVKIAGIVKGLLENLAEETDA